MTSSVDSETPFNHAVHWRIRTLNGSPDSSEIAMVSLELVDNRGGVLSSMKVPTAELREVLGPHRTPHVDLQLDGTLSAEFGVAPTSGQSPQHIDLLQLVSNALEPAMLEDEPDLIDQLLNLRQMLSNALNLVDRTLADLDNLKS